VIFRQRWEGFQILAKNLKAGDHAITTQEGSKGRAPCSRHLRCSRAKEWLGISPDTGGIRQSIHQLRPYRRPRSLLAAMADRALASAWNPASRDSSPSREDAIREWHADRDFECVPVWPFGNSRAGPERETARIADSYLRLSGNLPLGALGRRGCRKRTPGPPPFSSMNSTPAASKARRTAKSLATVREVLSSASSARLIVLSPSDDARARSFALHLRRARAARI
jgi:hypothetical protein